jgi:hypothetical protein
MVDSSLRDDQPGLDLFEYVLLSAADVAGLVPVAAAVVDLARTGAIHLVDAVVLARAGDRPEVRTVSPDEHPVFADLDRAADGGVLLSPHDVDLAAVTLAPEESALLLLVEDRWAEPLSAAVRAGGARVAAGERIPRDRVLASLDASESAERQGRVDLLIRGPRTASALDQVEQVRQLAELVDRGVLPLERYEVQRRRVLQG